jgi:hypothetical protein
MSSLQTLRRKLALQTLSSLQPILLLQMVMGISHSVNSRFCHSRTLARSLLLNSQQRLHELLASAPRLHLPVEQMLEFCRPDGAKHEPRTPEEAAAQALFELCLGLMLQWMSDHARSYATTGVACRRCAPVGPYPLSYPSLLPIRSRKCPHPLSI